MDPKNQQYTPWRILFSHSFVLLSIVLCNEWAAYLDVVCKYCDLWSELCEDHVHKPVCGKEAVVVYIQRKNFTIQ